MSHYLLNDGPKIKTCFGPWSLVMVPESRTVIIWCCAALLQLDLTPRRLMECQSEEASVRASENLPGRGNFSPCFVFSTLIEELS